MKKMILAQYAKWPQLGKVKTRIGRILGDDKALEIHIELTTNILKRFSEDQNIDYQLWFSPIDSQGDENYQNANLATSSLSELIKSREIICQEQTGPSLGVRMANTFRVLCKDYDQIAIVGSDCPNVTSDDLKAVSKGLMANDVVIIPAEDGGYVLIAMHKESIGKVSAEWLESVAWGQSKVLVETLACCEREGLTVALLPESWDVDEVEDYKRWKNKIA